MSIRSPDRDILILHMILHSRGIDFNPRIVDMSEATHISHTIIPVICNYEMIQQRNIMYHSCFLEFTGDVIGKQKCSENGKYNAVKTGTGIQ